MAKKPSGREQLRAESGEPAEAPEEVGMRKPEISPAVGPEVQVAPTPSPAITPAITAPQVQTVALSLPLGTIPPRCYVSRHCDAGSLTNAQATAMRQLLEGLQDTNAKLASGRRVTSSADVVRYLLEQVALTSDAGTT